MTTRIFFLLLFCCATTAGAQTIHPDILNKKWKAYWIAVPGEPHTDYGVYNFRKTITLAQKPSSFIVHVSADNRYKLFVNHSLVSLGPARGDIFHWNFETVDIAPYLKAGENVIGAVVWNFGEQRPEAQISLQTAFILQGNTPAEEGVNTNESWKCIRDDSYQPRTPDLIYCYYVSGPGENIDYNKRIAGWLASGYNDGTWKPAQQLFTGLPKNVFDWSVGWMLVPRSIPAPELTPQRLTVLRKAEGITLPKNFPKEISDITIPVNRKVTLLFDQEFLTNAYPVLSFSGGKDATITLRYAEALYKIEDTPDWKAQRQKGNRNDIEGKRFVGVSDQLISDGSSQVFTSLWWRTYRYLQVEVETKNEALVIHDLYGIFTGYPFRMQAQFTSSQQELNKILETGWRTARVCAVETYMDCPYYEQLQYIGDTRIQGLVSLFNAGDDRLLRNAISQLDNSRMAEGITLSRYPTAHAQEIPTFSLWWIGMVHDYWMYRPDAEFVKNKLAGVRQVLNFFMRYQQPDGSLKNAPYWEFTDWSSGEGWNAGMAPVGSDGHSAALDLQLCLAYQLAAQLEESLGSKEYAAQYTTNAAQLKQAITASYWDEGKGLFADTGEKKTFSQHVNTLAILTGTVAQDQTQKLMNNILSDKSLTPATIYFKYYLHRAVEKAGLGDRYISLLEDWRTQLANGLTTWAEISDHNNARSDAHAWGASPNIELFRIVLGVDSNAPGFSKVMIEPHLGPLTEAQGTIPHPNGEVSVRYYQLKGKWKADISIPKETTGTLIWKGKEYTLNAGIKNTLEL